MEEKLLSNMSEVPTLPAEMCSCDDCVAVMVRFKWDGSWGANQVSLAGSFNNWEEVRSAASPPSRVPPVLVSSCCGAGLP